MRDHRVGVYSSPSAIITSIPFAASTSSAVMTAGMDRACESMPKTGALVLESFDTGDGLGNRENVIFVERPVK